MNQKSWESLIGMRGYLGYPAERHDRAAGIKVGGECVWLVHPKPVRATITAITIDEDGDPLFDLTFDIDHKDVRVEREEIAECGPTLPAPHERTEP